MSGKEGRGRGEERGGGGGRGGEGEHGQSKGWEVWAKMNCSEGWGGVGGVGGGGEVRLRGCEEM